MRLKFSAPLDVTVDCEEIFLEKLGEVTVVGK